MINNILTNLIKNANIEQLMQNSIKDYHIKGFDYINLHRSKDLTVKLYFFDNIISNMSEVINPHDHRYDFDTFVIRGNFTDFTFEESDKGDVFNKFSYKTPLCGGDGFTFDSETKLSIVKQDTIAAGGQYFHKAEDLHTIRINTPDTVLCLLQYSDKDLDNTWTFSRDYLKNESGLYNQFTVDQFMKRLNSL